MGNVDFSKGLFFFKDFGVVYRNTEHFCTNKNLIDFIKGVQSRKNEQFRLHVFYNEQLADVRYALGYLTSLHGTDGFVVEFHRCGDPQSMPYDISDTCSVYLTPDLDQGERELISQLFEYGLKVVWNRIDLDEMLSFDEPFDPGVGKYFSKRLHDKGRLWYAIVEVESDFVDRIKVAYGSKFYRPYVSRSGDACIHVGRGSYISNNPRFFIDADFSLGNFCQVSTDFTAITRRHAVTNLSLGHLSGGGIGFFGEGEDLSKPIVVKNDVWIGTKVTLLPGITVENGCVIGAGSVVTKDCEPYGIYAGNPAKLIKYRFPKDKIEVLLESEWWSWPLREIWERRDVFINKVADLKVAQMKEMLGS